MTARPWTAGVARRRRLRPHAMRDELPARARHRPARPCITASAPRRARCRRGRAGGGRWQHPRTVRGAVHDAARPCRTQSMETHVGARVDRPCATASPARCRRGGAVAQEFVASRIAVLVRDTVERELRETVAPALNVSCARCCGHAAAGRGRRGDRRRADRVSRPSAGSGRQVTRWSSTRPSGWCARRSSASTSAS